MAHDEPNNVSLQDTSPTALSTKTPSVAIMVPTTNFEVVDPITTMKEYMRSLSTSKLKSQSIEALTSTCYGIVVNPLFDDLRRIQEKHGGSILEALTKMPELKQQFFDLIDEIIENQEGLCSQRKQEFDNLLHFLLKSFRLTLT